jgi:hypothetical protein
MEFQLGNLPQLEPKDQFSIYDQLNLGYRYKSLSFQSRIETYYPSFQSAEGYARLSQAKLQFISKNIDIQIGHQYNSFGRGLLLRTYEIPSSIWETRGYRVRYGFYKDMIGATLKLNFNDFETKILGGKILDVTLPPTIGGSDARRPDLIGGNESSYRFGKQKIGLIYMLHRASGGGTGSDIINNHYTSIYYDGVIAKNFFVYSEFAQKIQNDITPFLFSDESGQGGYIGVNYYKGDFGGSIEYKNYHNIFIGTGINDPPTLVREHSYRLLNRSTHIPILTDESGYQMEFYYNISDDKLITLNSSRSKNDISEDIQPVFFELFAEYQFSPETNFSGKVFVDYSQDPFINEINRYASGAYVEIAHKKFISTFDMEWQMINRMTTESIYFSNWYFNYGFSKASKFAATIQLELTGDPTLLDDDQDLNIFPATTFSYHITRKNVATLYYGKRRGGPACNSGVCYDVLSFEGLEIRFTTRF